MSLRLILMSLLIKVFDSNNKTVGNQWQSSYSRINRCLRYKKKSHYIFAHSAIVVQCDGFLKVTSIAKLNKNKYFSHPVAIMYKPI